VATLPTPDLRRELSVDALGGYAAVRLFLDRAIAARPDFSLTDKNAAAVARICHDLDGIPLALELAAARVRAMSAEVIADHLTDRFQLLKGGHLTALPRQQTLRATIDWSFDLLAPQERGLLRRLSAFTGGFALDAAEAVGAGDGVSPKDVLDVLGHLVDKSLVAFDAQTERYRLLETVRQYALERLAESGDEARARDAHLAFFVALAQRADSEILGPKQTIWRTRLDAERENILLAFDHARRAAGGGPAGLTMAHGLNQWFGWGHVELWYRVMLNVLAHPDAPHEGAARSHALYSAAQVAYLTARYDEAFALAQTSVGVARACGDPHALREALYRIGIAAIAVHREAEAREHFVEGLALARQAGHRTLIASFAGGMGELLSQQDQLDLAELHYLEALAIYRGDPENTGIMLANLARNAIALGDEAKAVQYQREVEATAGQQFSIQTAQAFLRNCAGLAALRGEWKRALRLSGAAASHREQHNLLGDFVDARFHIRDMAPAREALGNDAADAEFATGQSMDADAALLEAEAWLAALPAVAGTP
jgi:non-specific serine/threonine protein kinase